jgi:hypothetical protein
VPQWQLAASSERASSSGQVLAFTVAGWTPTHIYTLIDIGKGQAMIRTALDFLFYVNMAVTEPYCQICFRVLAPLSL